MDGGMMSTVSDGQMEVPFDGGTLTLTANLFAAKGISRHFGGFQTALNKMAAGDLEAFMAVMRFGAGITSDAEARQMEERVFRAGVLRLTAPLTEFVLICANGGKPLDRDALSDQAKLDGRESAPGKADA